MAKRAAKKLAPSPDHLRAGWSSGWAEGYRTGSDYGYHLGRCEAIIRQHPLPSLGWWDKRVTFVTSGKGLPYSPLDESVIEALRGLVRELIVVQPGQDFASVAIQSGADAVIVLEGMNVPGVQLDRIRSAGISTAIWLTDDPYYTDMTIQMVRHYDHVFTLELQCVGFYKQNGCRQVHYLPFAANTRLFRPKPIPTSFRRDISFIGSAYWNRVAYFDRMAPYLKDKHVYISGIWWDRLRHFRMLASKIDLNKWMNADETASFYNGSKIVINLHRATDDASFNNNSRLIGALSPNPRTFEIAACGTLQLTDVRHDLARFYTPGTEIVTYSSVDELKYKIDYYLRNEEERRAIALNALRRTIREHTYPHRVAQLLQILFG
ncbi:glycosyltransferase [Paenibacillus doosanensis]|uniref:Spore protein YkvP n=1 Tax=Paenibacillus konkukensis TaxID=2020716 RepID=A0ABY4RXR1_9BACL|nr:MULTISPECIES: glycosyltransferase [Paenibacillus]MCS7458837.1 glycosyltransferase [Paenibacillus doosanensis]UQZ86635.1 Spore protein YkvP [Paenibacillus konkukensis]